MQTQSRFSIAQAQQEAARLADDNLLAQLRRLVSQDRALTARLLIHLAEVDARGLYRAAARPSMFDYAVHALHMSESEAYVRIRVARLSRQFPTILPLLEQGELHLSALKLLAPVLTAENCAELLRDARFKTKSQVETMLARRFAKPDVPSAIRKLPVRSTAVREGAAGTAAEAPVESVPMAMPLELHVTGSASEAVGRETRDASTNTAELPAPAFQLAPPPRAASAAVAPLSATRYKVQFTADQRLYDKLKQAQDLLRHQAPDGDLAIVLERALDLLIADRLKQRFALGARAARARAMGVVESKAGSRHIPHDVRRAVIARDGIRCTFASADGSRCEQRGLLELHHERPYGRGGPSSVQNVRVLCRAHNQLFAERDYGREFVRRRMRERRSDGRG
jgi:hypothetical protein